ncbi:MAG: hypothetical protein M1495_19125 [Bacteroidetes bacterium]|nr:hypothetical protein [Bacteroidota bacterium]MCL6099034.1 hypothetical protein [Bacteroidota bacterium]
MGNTNNTSKKLLLTGSIIAGALLGAGAPKTINAANLFDYHNLGSGSELRSLLLNSSAERNLELKCGNKGDSKSDAKPASDAKTKDAKCGEGKCGDKKMESKAKDAKCGEKKMDAKATKAANGKKMESKAKDGKCGESKCGDKKSESKAPAKETQRADQK